MAISVIGLKTYIWNSRIKSALFLLLYPLIITPVYIAVGAVIWLWAASEFNGFSKSMPFEHAFQTILLHFWYVPYIIVLVYLLCMYLYQRNHLNIAADERTVTRASHPALYETLERLCISRGMVMPHFFIREHASANAYSSGLSASTYSIAITTTLIDKLTPDEIECVLAHELTHIINGDTQMLYVIGSVSHMFQGLARLFSPFTHRNTDDEYGTRYMSHISPSMLRAHANEGTVRASELFGTVGLVLGWIFSLGGLGSLIAFLFISHKREYMADAGAVELTKNPEALISALYKIEHFFFGYDPDPIKRPSYIFYYAPGQLLSTHPAMADRIAAIAQFSNIQAAPPKQWQPVKVRPDSHVW